jgi:hypothetical protein
MATMPNRDVIQHWRKKALEARELAARISLTSDQIRLLKMAEQYERMANAAEERQRRQLELGD